MTNKEYAKHYLSLGLNPVPIDKFKKSERKKHNSVRMTNEEIDHFDFLNIGVSTGIISGGLEAIDFDLKNASDPDWIMNMFKEKVPKELLLKLVIQQTISGGYHLIYRCEDITSSNKLAKNEKGEAIIETRGEGGYIKCYPSENYKLLQGNFDNIPIISPSERLSLFVAAKMLNTMIIKDIEKRRTSVDKNYLKKFPKYNDDIDIGLKLLQDHGWTIHSEDNTWINLTRPNKHKSDGISGGYNKEGKFLYVFSTSQDHFELERAYNNHAILAELVYEGDYKLTYAKLYDAGYGEEESKDNFKTDSELENEEWDKKLEDLSFLSDDIEENSYLNQSRKNEIQQGKTTGWNCLDPYLRIKDNSVNFGLGFDGVGKSLVKLAMVAASNVLHGNKYALSMPENKTAMTRRRLIQLLSGKQITQLTDKEYNYYLKYCRENFKIISNKKHYSIDDILLLGKKLYEMYGINGLVIDPYNFYKVEGNAYNHDNRILSKLRVFAEKYCSVDVMAHPNSDYARSHRKVGGYLEMPDKYGIQGGANFAYRIDDFTIFHRIVNHEDSDVRKIMQVRVDKVKEYETGGRPHSLGEWTELTYEYRNDFLGYWDEEGNNPLYNAYLNREGLRNKRKKRQNINDIL